MTKKKVFSQISPEKLRELSTSLSVFRATLDTRPDAKDVVELRNLAAQMEKFLDHDHSEKTHGVEGPPDNQFSQLWIQFHSYKSFFESFRRIAEIYLQIEKSI